MTKQKVYYNHFRRTFDSVVSTAFWDFYRLILYYVASERINYDIRYVQDILTTVTGYAEEN